MVGLTVDRPKGAPSDVAELEYCSAIRQTDLSKPLRTNGSLTSTDVQLHLISRHALRAPLEQIENEILVELAGGQQYEIEVLREETEEANSSSLHSFGRQKKKKKKEPEDEADESEASMFVKVQKTTPLDLVQQTALLLIPHLQRLFLEEEIGQVPTAPQATVGGICDGKHQDNSDGIVDTDVGIGTDAGSSPDDASNETNKRIVDKHGFGKKSEVRWSRDGEDEENDMTMIGPILRLILQESGLEYGTELSAEVIRTILTAFGEDHWSDDVVEQMLAQASDSKKEIPILDGKTFLKAMTADTKVYNPDWEDSPTTIWNDVNSNPKPEQRKSSKKSRRFTNLRNTMLSTEGVPPKLCRFYTADSIDYTADSYMSFSWAILVWFAIVTTFFSYFFFQFQHFAPQLPCYTDDTLTFGCAVAEAIIDWLILFLQLSLIGFAYLFLATLGNSTYLNEGNKWIAGVSVLISMTVIVFTTMVAYGVGIRTAVVSTEKDQDLQPLYISALVVGCLVVILQLVHLGRMVFPSKYDLPGFFDRFASSSSKIEQQTKQAARFKINRMVENARSCHCSASAMLSKRSLFPGSEDFGREGLNNNHNRISNALCNYNARISGATERIGGVLYVIQNYWFGSSLIQKEGIVVFPRLLWSNLGQFFVVLAIMYFWVYLTTQVRNLSDPVFDGLSRAGLEIVVAVGAIFGLAAVSASTVQFIPSAIRTFLELRSGILPTLRNKTNFHPYRFAQDNCTLIFGATFWGTVVTGIVVWIFFAGIVFLLVFEYTRQPFLLFIAQLIGVLTTIVLKLIILQLLRFSFYGGFYRRRPLAANIENAILESWNLGLSTAFISLRTLKLLCLTVFYIGRIDIQFLSAGVGRLFGKFDVDNLPLAFRKDILIHDAHRHPYMERSAFLFMLKLRYRDKFGTQAGAVWRILYVLALMPWMKKYRVHPARAGRLLYSKDNEAMHTDESFEDIFLEKQALQLEVGALREENNRMIELQDEVQRLRRSVVVLQERLEI